ncbi:MAG: DNA mismatch repair endonuclease MutL, partial [Lentisphaeria bacterium]
MMVTISFFNGKINIRELIIEKTIAMSKIKILPPEITNLIAAGEVVERPASIVKELIENSLDAQATRIRVNIQSGGRKLVQISDNGHGMNREDALLCIEPHATSKIRSEQDVERISTMGFRGEALPSIAAVTNFTLDTCLHDEQIGSSVIINGGRVADVHDVGTAPGTTISARNLFFNMPVRRKFLRSEQTESIHIQSVVEQQALANPNISFELIQENKSIIKVNSGTLEERVAMLLGKDWLNEMIAVSYEQSDISVFGYIARPGVSRSTRKDQTFFINRRPVFSDTLFHAIRDAYSCMLQKGRYAPVLLFIQMHAGLVDVNVHPQKREVRFRNNSLVGEVIANTISQGMQNFHQLQQESLRNPNTRIETFNVNQIRPGFSTLTANDFPNYKQESKVTNQDETSQIRKAMESIIQPDALPSIPKIKGNFSSSIKSENMPTEKPAVAIRPTLPPPVVFPLPEANMVATNVQKPLFQVDKVQQHLFDHLRIIGTLSDTYILAEGSEGLVVIDQSAAHRRILYERIINNFNQDGTKGQPLLLPVTLDLSSSDQLIVMKNLAYFHKVGFGIEHFGGNTFVITSVPANFPEENLSGLFQQIIDDLSMSTNASVNINEQKLAIIAAKYAVRQHKI